ncbi:MAG: hypothetical protein K1W01_05190 [Muribaculaceae bacterium]
MRLLAFITIQPYLAKGSKLTPEKLLPFPWDPKVEKHAAPPMSANEQRARMEQLVAKLGAELI